MKKIVVSAIAILSLASVAAYAQTEHQHGTSQPTPPQDRPTQGVQGPAAGQGETSPGGMGHGMMGRMMQGGQPAKPADGFRPKGDTGPSSLAFHGINLQMHDKMNITYSGNSDVDFIKAMIPHHQAALDMAKTALAFGKDPAVRKLAEEIIKAQENEIAVMQNWLKANGH